jgi:hypothetical protein
MDDIDLARKTIEHAFWEMFYHEEKLHEAHHKLGLVTALLARAGMELDPQTALAIYKDDEEGADLPTFEAFATHLLGSAIGSIEYQEGELTDAHRQVAAAKALILRAGLEGEISFAEAEAHAKKRLEPAS